MATTDKKTENRTWNSCRVSRSSREQWGLIPALTEHPIMVIPQRARLTTFPRRLSFFHELFPFDLLFNDVGWEPLLPPLHARFGQARPENFLVQSLIPGIMVHVGMRHLDLPSALNHEMVIDPRVHRRKLMAVTPTVMFQNGLQALGRLRRRRSAKSHDICNGSLNSLHVHILCKVTPEIPLAKKLWLGMWSQSMSIQRIFQALQFTAWMSSGIIREKAFYGTKLLKVRTVVWIAHPLVCSRCDVLTSSWSLHYTTCFIAQSHKDVSVTAGLPGVTFWIWRMCTCNTEYSLTLYIQPEPSILLNRV